MDKSIINIDIVISVWLIPVIGDLLQSGIGIDIISYSTGFI